jgi:hypothetical protein
LADLPEFYVIELNISGSRCIFLPDPQYRTYWIDVYGGKLSEFDENANPLFSAIREATLKVFNFNGMCLVVKARSMLFRSEI